MSCRPGSFSSTAPSRGYASLSPHAPLSSTTLMEPPWLGIQPLSRPNVSQKRLGGLVLDKFQPNVAVAVPCNLKTASHRDACRSASFPGIDAKRHSGSNHHRSGSKNKDFGGLVHSASFGVVPFGHALSLSIHNSKTE